MGNSRPEGRLEEVVSQAQTAASDSRQGVQARTVTPEVADL